MKKIAVIQSRSTDTAIAREQKNIVRSVQGLAAVTFHSSLEEESRSPELLDQYDGVIFGGSSDFDFHGSRDPHDPARIMSHEILHGLEKLIKRALNENFPVLGICFGHQLIGHTFGAECVNDKTQSKLGTFEVHLTAQGREDKLLSQLPETFNAQYAHKDTLTRLPEDATLLAQSPKCKYAALRYGGAMYTLQFHPEVEMFERAYSHAPSSEASSIIPLWIKTIVDLSE